MLTAQSANAGIAKIINMPLQTSSRAALALRMKRSPQIDPQSRVFYPTNGKYFVLALLLYFSPGRP
jgi:hypothetical protein